LTKCRCAVGIGVERPGKASAAVGISSFLRNENMAGLQSDIGDGGANIIRTPSPCTRHGDHVFRHQASGIGH
jgi:hypothetical protein